MKYMTFNSSCAWAGVANMLEQAGVDAEDRQLALEAGLPWIFVREGDAFLTGPMLQSAAFFDLCLLPRGFRMQETRLAQETLCAWLQRQSCAMLGLPVNGRKHALVYTGIVDGNFRFLNNKRQDSPEPELRLWSEEELLSMVGEHVTAAALVRVPRQTADPRPFFRASLQVMSQLREALFAFCSAPQDPAALRLALDPLFRAPLLDGLTMAEISGQTELAGELKVLQTQLMTLLREGRRIAPAEVLDLPLLTQALDRIYQNIEQRSDTASL